MCLYGLSRQLEKEETEEGLFEYVARLNGPLPDYHPQMLLQCLLWGRSSLSLFLNGAHCWNTDKLDLVKEILVHLSREVEKRPELQDDAFRMTPIPISHYLKRNHISSPVSFSPCCPVPDFSHRYYRSQGLTAGSILLCSTDWRKPTSEHYMGFDTHPLIVAGQKIKASLGH